jgi:predicted transcriptional regulator
MDLADKLQHTRHVVLPKTLRKLVDKQQFRPAHDRAREGEAVAIGGR